MKNILLFFALVLAFSTLSYSQKKGMDWGSGKVFVDSLNGWHDSTGGSWYRASDSTANFEWDYLSGFPSGLARDTGTTYVDTLKFYKGTIRFSNAFPYGRQDTLWSDNALPIKIDYWNVDTVLVLGGKTKHFIILDQNIMLLKVVRLMTDGYGVGAGIKTDIILEGFNW